VFGKFGFYIKDFDWFIFLLALSIAVVGVVEIHSATQYNRGDRFFIKQIYWIILGLILMLAVMSIDYHTLSKMCLTSMSSLSSRSLVS
jgi:rod shape determining protein RodA